MIIRELLDVPCADQVDAAVTDVGNGKKILSHQHGHNGGAHAGLPGSFRGYLDNFRVGLADGTGERVRPFRESFDRLAHGRILPFSRLAKIIEHDVHTYLAGHLTRSLPAHAVANHEYPELGVIPEIIFVVGADAADVALARHLDA